MARLSEMIYFIWQDICQSKKQDAVTVVITGGGAKLQVLSKIIPEVTGINISKPQYDPSHILPEIGGAGALVRLFGYTNSGTRDYQVSLIRGDMPITSQFTAEFRRIGGLKRSFSHLNGE